MPDEPKSDFSMWHGIAGRRRQHHPEDIEIDRAAELKKLPLDQLVVRETLRQDLGCPGCGRTFQRRVWFIRCGRCAVLDFPRLTVFAACEQCGDDSEALGQHARHHDEHRTYLTGTQVPVP